MDAIDPCEKHGCCQPGLFSIYGFTDVIVQGVVGCCVDKTIYACGDHVEELRRTLEGKTRVFRVRDGECVSG